MSVAVKPSVELKQELLLSVRALLMDRMVGVLDLAERHDFSIKVGNARSVMVVVNRNNIHFLNPKLG